MWLVDTNIISELARREPAPDVLRWAETVDTVALSVVTVEEIHYGLTWHPNPRILAWFGNFLADSTVLPISDEIARRAGELRGELAGRGVVRTQADMLIAATAQFHRLVLVTRNTRDFTGCGIGLLDPFKPDRSPDEGRRP